MARRLIKRAATCKSPFVQQCAQEYLRISPKQKFVADFVLDPKGDEGQYCCNCAAFMQFCVLYAIFCFTI